MIFQQGTIIFRNFSKLYRKKRCGLFYRPGPYVCAEWELGGIPPYLLRIPDIKLRCMDPRYMAAAEKYIAKLAEVIKPFLDYKRRSDAYASD